MDFLKSLICGFSKVYVLRLKGKRVCILCNKKNNCSRIIEVEEATTIRPIANW